MVQSSDHRSRAISRHLKRISDELARHLDGAGGTALLVSPFRSKVWRVEAGRDGDGAFLGRGWPEFVVAHGIGVLWFVVFRHEGGGLLTVKAFDTNCFVHEFSRPIINGYSPEFVKNHMNEAEPNSRLAVLLNLCGKYWRVEAEKDRPGNVCFSGGWSRFLTSNGIAEGEALLLRYEGNLVFTVKAFGVDGCQKSCKSTKIPGLRQIQETDQMKMKEEEDAPSSSVATGKRKSRNEAPGIAETKRPASSSTPSKKGTAAGGICTYHIGPQSWIRKMINAYVLTRHLPLAPTFCKAIGFSKPCEITLRTTSTGDSATRSWQVRGCMYTAYGIRQLGKGWTSFCRDNGLKEGDVCTFNIIETTLWHVDIKRCS